MLTDPDYGKVVELMSLKENAQEVLRSVGGLETGDAMNALGAAVAHTIIENWSEDDRHRLFAAWCFMVRGSLNL